MVTEEDAKARAALDLRKLLSDGSESTFNLHIPSSGVYDLWEHLDLMLSICDAQDDAGAMMMTWVKAGAVRIFIRLMVDFSSLTRSSDPRKATRDKVSRPLPP